MKKNKIVQTLFFYLFGSTLMLSFIEKNFTLENHFYYISLIIMNLIIITILFLINKTEIIQMFKDFKQHYQQYLKTGIIIWLICFIIMILLNYFINYHLLDETSLSANENIIRNTIFNNLFYSLISLVLIQPALEELVFRQGFNQIKNQYLFLGITSSLFALLHIINDLNEPIKLLYFFPYLSLGVAFGLSYYKTKNYFTSLIIHSLHNFITLLLVISI